MAIQVKIGQTWRLKGDQQFRAIKLVREDGCTLYDDRNAPWTGEWLAIWADIIDDGEAPRADPLAGVDWSRFLPREDESGHDSTLPQPGDVWATRADTGRRAVIQVGLSDAGQLLALFLADTAGMTGSQLSFVPGHLDERGMSCSRLIARDGKLVAQPTPEKVARTLPVAKFMEEKRIVVAPPLRAHDFSNPYLTNLERTGRRCVDCGLMLHEAPTCTPRPGWRAEHENRIALVTDETARFRVRVDSQPTPEPWEPSVDDYDLLPDSWR